MLIELLLIFFLGAAIGSFLNVFVDRGFSGESFVKGRSRCDKCRENIAWYDLIPLVSFLNLGARCRFCKSSLSFYYLFAEIITGALFTGAFLFLSLMNASFTTIVYYLAVMSILIVVFLEDLKFGTISDKIIYPSILLVSLYLVFYSPNLLIPNLLSAMGAVTFFLLLLLITGGKGMGVGDIKFSILMGLILGFPQIIVGLYLSFLTGAVVSIILILWRKKKLRGSTIPFGPFLVLGTVFSLFYSNFFIELLMTGIF